MDQHQGSAAGHQNVAIPPQAAAHFLRLGRHDAHPWMRMPWKGVYNKVLFFDPVTGTTLELAKVERGCTFPEHYHTSSQSQFLVSGRLRTGDGSLIEPGNFTIIPAGQRHGPFIAEEESVTFKWFSSTPVYILLDGEAFVYQQDGSMIAAGSMQGALDAAQRADGKNFISPSAGR